MPNDLEQFAGGELKEWLLQPDAAVWDAVAERIRKERRRRIIFWWTSAAVLLLLIAGTWVLFQEDHKTELSKLNHTKPKTEQATKKISQSKSSIPESQINNTAKALTVTHYQPEVQALSGKHQQPVSNKVKKQFLLSNWKTSQTQSDHADSKPIPVLQTEQVDLLQLNNLQKESPVVAKESVLKNEEVALNLIDAKKEVPVKQELVSEKADTIPISAIDSVKQRKNKRKQPNWYFTAQTGFSDIRPNELLRLATAQDMQFSGGNSPVIGAGNISGIAISLGNLQYKAGFAFSFGAGLNIFQRKKWQFTAGIQYRYASMHLITGAKVDTMFQARESRTNAATTVTAFYRPGNGYTYQHQFHFLQLPMVFHVQPFGMEKWRLDAGLLPGVLLGAKALHYNEGNNIFYSSNQQYQRLLLNASLGVQYAVSKRKGKTIWVGPQVEIGLRNMHQPQLSRKAFFQSANISFTIQ